MAYLLAIESSCDDTSAAVLNDDLLLSNMIAGQKVHEIYGGVVPELASRAHLQNIVPVVDTALKTAGIDKRQLEAIAFTRGPGLLGSLLVGVSFAKAMALSLDIPLVEVNHLQAHVLSHFLRTPQYSHAPKFPFLCLLVSGGHTQILQVNAPDNFKVLGGTIDDAAGECIDKAAKIMGLPYPGGPVIDKLAQAGDGQRFRIAKPRIPALNYSFSGLKTSFLYLVRDGLKKDPDFITRNLNHLCASVQQAVVDCLLEKLVAACRQTGIHQVAIAGGVSANSLLRGQLERQASLHGWEAFIPPFSFTTDNAAMVGIAGYFKLQQKAFCPMSAVPYARS
ncbi:MAG: tRNA (adenosine(37)-N6)-threonylcarbamoyltransferase complex transferase subunit TsaD [Bacteroidales bacterium]|nr:tRNA (adenosine(37)-N6)-threonylcarbamoyltransferase complex transferase subunit TsaD [Bacteroidales bacterium]MDE7072786.1 tRNA (adenosine(37)-N6)-threonylcarbamoyltransferase complex transferase subunit TsaD [Bacteroidales bacterium]